MTVYAGPQGCPDGDYTIAKFYEGLSLQELDAICKALGVSDSAPRSMPVPLLARCLARHYLANHPYVRWSKAHLRKVVRQRGKRPGQMVKSALVEYIEARDADIAFPFLSLPAELRLYVYRSTFMQYDNKVFHHEGNRDKPIFDNPPVDDLWEYDDPSSPLRQHMLTRVCTQIRAESLPVFFELQTPSLDYEEDTTDSPRIPSWERRLKKRSRRLTSEHFQMPKWLANSTSMSVRFMKTFKFSVVYRTFTIHLDHASSTFDIIEPGATR